MYCSSGITKGLWVFFVSRMGTQWKLSYHLTSRTWSLRKIRRVSDFTTFSAPPMDLLGRGPGVELLKGPTALKLMRMSLGQQTWQGWMRGWVGVGEVPWPAVAAEHPSCSCPCSVGHKGTVTIQLFTSHYYGPDPQYFGQNSNKENRLTKMIPPIPHNLVRVSGSL